MKAIVCEMCSSRDVVKDGDYYVCQSCGTKYTVESAKKLMVEVEGKVDVSGSTVKVDNSDSLENYRKLARRARESGNSENAAKYYEMVAVQDPSDWEAAFYSVFCRAADTNLANLVGAANRVTGIIEPTCHLILGDPGMDDEQRKDANRDIANSVKALCKAFADSTYDHYNRFSTVDGAFAERNSRLFAAYSMVSEAASCSHDYFHDDELASTLYAYCYAHDSGMDKSILLKKIMIVDPALGASIKAANEKANEEKQAKKLKNKKMLGNLCFIIAGLIFLLGIFTLIYNNVVMPMRYPHLRDNPFDLSFLKVMPVSLVPLVVGILIHIKAKQSK